MTSEAYLNTQSDSINSTDEGPGPKRLEELQLKHGTFFIIYFLMNIFVTSVFESATQLAGIFPS